MKKSSPKQFVTVITPDSDGNWIVEFPQLPGLHTFGSSLAHAKRNAQAALREWFSQHEKIGIPVRIRA